MTTWTCVRCGRPADESRLRAAATPNYRLGYCLNGHREWFIRATGETLKQRGMGPDRGQARHTDPDTSHAAAAKVRPNSAKAALLEVHRQHPDGLTDEEAARYAGLSLQSEYATRCSELTRAGLLEVTEQRRDGAAGMDRIVRRIVA